MKRASMPCAWVAAAFLVLAARVEAAPLAVTWTSKNGAATVRRVGTRPPWRFRGLGIATGGDAFLHQADGQLFVGSRSAGTIAAIDRRRWQAARVYALGENSEPEDIAVTSADTAYITRRRGTRLLRLDLRSGATTESVDLSPFADDDGVPDLGTMIVDRGRLFVQIRRMNEDGPFGLAPPGYLAVVDLATEQLVDVDPQVPGVQAIELQGTAPKLRMQILPDVRRLYVSATGGFFDAGGLEVIDLGTLRSHGLIVREADGFTGADLGAFVMVTPERGYVVYSTDLDLSSHLKAFSVTGGVEPGPELHVSVGYSVPALALDRRAGTLFVPDGAFSRRGVHVFDAATGQRLRTEPVGTAGQPTDILLLPLGRGH